MLDTCVLWPSKQRDLLLSLCAERLYRPLWSSVILEELQYHESRKLQEHGVAEDAADARAHRLVEVMAAAFDDALVTGWERLEGIFGLPDPNDEHVVAAAVTAGADVIVTANLKDMPPDLIPEHIDIQSPQRFLANTVTVDPQRAGAAVQSMLSRYSKPKITLEGLLTIFEQRYQLNDAVAVLRQVCLD